MSKAGASGVSGCEAGIQSCGAAPGASRFWHSGIVLMLSVPPASDDAIHAGRDRSGCGRDRPEAGCAVSIRRQPRNLVETQHDGRVACDDAAALQALGDHEVVDLARLDLRALEHGSHHHLGERERVRVDQRSLARTADRRSDGFDDDGVLHGSCQPRRPWRQNSQASSAVTRVRGFWTRRFMSQLYITVCWISRAARRVSLSVDGAGRDRGVEQLDQHARDRGHHRGQALGVLDRELQRELRDRNAVVRSALAARPERLAPFVETDREGAQPLERFGFGLDGLAEVLERLADDLLEQREQQLVLAVEVLVEPAQRLLRAIDDLLDRELGRALLVDQAERRVHQPLDALLGARARSAQAARDRPLTPTRRIAFLRVVGFRHGRIRVLSPASLASPFAQPAGKHILSE